MGLFPKILITVTGVAWLLVPAVCWALALREATRFTGSDYPSIIARSPWSFKDSMRIAGYKKFAWLWLALWPLVIVLESIAIGLVSLQPVTATTRPDWSGPRA